MRCPRPRQRGKGPVVPFDVPKSLTKLIVLNPGDPLQLLIPAARGLILAVRRGATGNASTEDVTRP
jgi:hypothetical protein